jgi:transcriptional regulator with XRE-family HTH domain
MAKLIMDYNEFFDYIKEKLNIKTDRELSKKLEISYSFLSEIRHGKKDITFKKIYNFLNKLNKNLTIIDLFKNFLNEVK